MHISVSTRSDRDKLRYCFANTLLAHGWAAQPDKSVQSWPIGIAKRDDLTIALEPHQSFILTTKQEATCEIALKRGNWVCFLGDVSIAQGHGIFTWDAYERKASHHAQIALVINWLVPFYREMFTRKLGRMLIPCRFGEKYLEIITPEGCCPSKETRAGLVEDGFHFFCACPSGCWQIERANAPESYPRSSMLDSTGGMESQV